MKTNVLSVVQQFSDLKIGALLIFTSLQQLFLKYKPPIYVKYWLSGYGQYPLIEKPGLHVAHPLDR